MSLASLSPLFSFLLEIGDALFQALQIRKHQFGFDRLQIRDRIDAAFDVGDVVVLKATQHVGDGVAFADCGEKLVAQPFAF